MEGIKFNVQKFKNVMIKGTLNYCIDYLQLKFQEKKIKTAMVSSQRSVVTFLNLDSSGIIDLPEGDDIVMNFFQPSRQLYHFDLINTETAHMKIVDDEKLVLVLGENNTEDIFFTSESSLKHNILKRSFKDDFPYFFETKITQELLAGSFDAIKKGGAQYGKFYIVVKNNKLFIEAADRGNSRADKTTRIIKEDVDMKDLSICFDLKNFIALTQVIELSRESDQKEFDMKIAYIEEREGGMIHVASTDNSEQYFLLNRES
jgi:hypothetical protein